MVGWFDGHVGHYGQTARLFDTPLGTRLMYTTRRRCVGWDSQDNGARKYNPLATQFLGEKKL